MGTLASTNAELGAAFLAENLSALGAAAATCDLIRQAAPAEVWEAEPGLELIRFGSHLLGAPTDVGNLAEARRDDGPVVVFGLGTGDAVRAVRAASDAPIVVYEPDAGIARAVLERGPTDLGDTELVCTLHDLGQAWTTLAQSGSGATIVRSPGYRECFAREHEDLERTVGELVQRSGINQNTHRMRARTWVEDVLCNVDRLLDAVPFRALGGMLAGVPAFIVGAGPSLAANAPLLAQATRKGLVIATNSSARVLAGHGVVPQVLCCIESIDVSHLLAPLPFIDEVVRAFSLSAHPKTLATGKGPLFPVWEAIPEIALPLERLTGHSGLAVSGSVSTLAFSLAYALGCSPIVLVGQDLAYTGQRTHAAGSAFEDSRVEVGQDGELHIAWCETVKRTRAGGGPPLHTAERLESVPAWGGRGEVPSGPSFAGPRAWFAGAAELLRQSGAKVELINATEGGSRIPGFEERTLEDVLRALSELGPSVSDLCRFADECGSGVTPASLRRWASAELALAEAVSVAARGTRRAAEVALRAMAAGAPRKVMRAFERLSAAELALRTCVGAAPMVDAWAFVSIDRALSGLSVADDARAAAVAAVEREVLVARAIETAAGEIGAVLQPMSREPEPARTEPVPSQGEENPCRL